jgi:hypothetical protein
MARRSWKIKKPANFVAEWAVKLDPLHDLHIAEGYRLCASSGFWRTKSNGITARFVYRSADRSSVITHIIRGIPAR